MINGIQKPVDQPILNTIWKIEQAAAQVERRRLYSYINGEKIATWNDLVVTFCSEAILIRRYCYLW